jgi:hypothetical protein
VAAAQFACQLMRQEQGDINNIIFRSSVRLSICVPLALFSSIPGAASGVQLSHCTAKRRRMKRDGSFQPDNGSIYSFIYIYIYRVLSKYLTLWHVDLFVRT